MSFILAGCAGTPRQPSPPPNELELLNRSAQLAFEGGHYGRAATLYEVTLDRALIQDQPAAIIDARFNLALSQTYTGRYQSALNLVILAEAERVRRQLGPDPELQLLRATIHYRAGDPAAAQRVLDPLLVEPPSLSPPTAARAHFLAGLLAADRSDAAALRRHRDALPDGGGTADRLELDGRLSAIEGDVEQALQLLDRAAALHSLEGDYRGMTRALVAAGTFAERAGRTGSAGGYWLRAGRSGARREEPDALAWLERARVLGAQAGNTALVLEAEWMLAELKSAQRSP